LLLPLAVEACASWLGVEKRSALFFGVSEISVANNALIFSTIGGGRLMRIARRFAVALAALSVCLMATAAHAGAFTLSTEGAVANGVVVTYDPGTGNVSYDGNGLSISSLELKSAGGLFDASKVNAGVIAGPFDLINAGKFFKLVTPPGVPSVDVGPVLPPGLAADAIMADIEVDGSLVPSGKLPDAAGGGPYLYVVPEPSSMALIFCGLLGLLGLRRK
jgi:hypothetical protein